MDYSSSWLMNSSNSSNRHHGRGGGTLSLFDDSPIHEVDNKVVATRNWLNNETEALVEELNRVNGENERLKETLTVVCENYNELRKRLTEYMAKNNTTNYVVDDNVTKKRKVDNNVTVAINSSNNNNSTIYNTTAVNNNVDSSSSDEDVSCGKLGEEAIQAKVSRVAVRTEASDSSLILKDGYQWRKYGQKVTRDNPCPRAYFKCSFAPTCPVKKKVQRSLDDQSMLVATYEGEHNHSPPQQESQSGSSRVITVGPVPSNSTLGSSGPTVTFDLTKPEPSCSNETAKLWTANTLPSQLNKFNSGEFQKLLAEQMASSLTKDPSFTSALAAAISGRVIQHSSNEL